jgi:2-C-methyl-D-erythritol 4-phosphate cytidylyltransferase/2-C-methyl-D-erythritol 2,4-cyclodiphosphate synthase
MSSCQNNFVIVLAAGKSERMQSAVPKQYRLLGNMPVLRHSLLRLNQARAQFKKIVVVIQEKHEPFYRQAIDGLPSDLFFNPIEGGKTRQTSVLAGLKALLPYQAENVLIHDAARPFFDVALIENTFKALTRAKGAVCACRINDTLKRTINGLIIETVDRTNLYAAQTPQAFHFKTLLAAHEAALEQERYDFTDDAALLEWRGESVVIVDAPAENFKLTTADDFLRAKTLLQPAFRSALGYDVHAFDEGDHVMLGGICVPFKRGIKAHSDGDVILHALADAIFGLAGNGDIGEHFPPSDQRWKNANSKIFVDRALNSLNERGGKLDHCDITLIAQEPKIAPLRGKIIVSLAEMLDLPTPAIGLKATTSEGLGFIGRAEGLAAFALVTAQF